MQSPEPPRDREPRLLSRLFRIEPEERDSTWLAALAFAALLAGYMLLRPVRETMGLAGGVKNLKWLFLVTLSVMFVAQPLLAHLVRRTPRKLAVAVIYRFFQAQLLLFAALMLRSAEAPWLGRSFYVWVSVFNLFAVSVFWAVVSDRFHEKSARRVFGPVAAGGTVGAILGSLLARTLVEHLGLGGLLLLSLLLLEVGVQLLKRFMRHPSFEPGTGMREIKRQTSLLAGPKAVVQSPLLMRLALYMLGLSLTASLIYFLQGRIVDEATQDPAERVRIFASINLWTQVLTLVLELAITARMLARFGPGPGYMALPSVVMAGAATLAMAPVLAVLVGLQVVRQATNYGLAKPARELVYTRVGTTERYLAKPFLDTFLYRGGDVMGAGLFALVETQSIQTVAWLAVALAVCWSFVAVSLTRAYRSHGTDH